MQCIKKAADGILFNLGFEIPSIAIPIVHSIAMQQKPMFMLSYSHINNDFCDKILELLDQKIDLFNVWIDKRYCKNSTDIWESIAKGIKNSDLIICIRLSEYLTSKACRQEIIYAKGRLNKRFLPIYLGKPDISDWSDIRLAEFKYVRFQNTHLKLDERKVEEFLSRVVESISSEHSTQNNITIKHHYTPSIFHEISKTEVIRSQTISQPIETFAKHDICSEIRDIYQFKTGAQMITYGECLKDGWINNSSNFRIIFYSNCDRKA
ncbi:unnamed protein product [Rotaria sordida]|uniref:TIR domain-containing protein n=1 Tax=Rotaria sordida TaxID=392033 RepID=A0A818KYJ7_9BILA|nr:unnamed protein product [Rotaria sordida]